MRDEAVHLTLAVEGGADSDDEELDRLTAQLRERLLELDVQDVESVRSGEIPDGARPVDPMTVGALIVTLVPAVLQSVVALVETWSRNRRIGGVKLTIDGSSLELGEASAEQQQRLVQLFLDQHTER